MIVDLPYCTVSYTSPVTTIRFKENAELDAFETREMIAAVQLVGKNRPCFLLSDARGDLNITSEGRKIAADKIENPNLIANAVVVDSLSVKLTANFFLKFNKPYFKLKIFNTEEKAMEWLLNLHARSKNVVLENA
jgi:hypothetical protein